MDAKLEKTTTVLTIALILLTWALLPVRNALSSTSGADIDLFTQKEPCSGKGRNVRSDAFELGEEAQIYAYVTYNGFPVEGATVSFRVTGPANSTQSVAFNGGAIANASGLASISFRIPYLDQIAFGEWVIVGNTRIGENFVNDSVTFRVGWIVEILSAKTVDRNDSYEDKFALGGLVGIILDLHSISMTEKSATLTVTLYDTQEIVINSTEVDGFAIPPNETTVQATFFLGIPRNANVGSAILHANAFTKPLPLGGVPYCPPISKEFLIVSHDVSVLHVQTYPTIVYIGELVHINVTAANKGSEPESFSVNVYYNQTLIDSKSVFDLPPSSAIITHFTWNTSAVTQGLYLTSALATTVPEEIGVSDNTHDGGLVEVKNKPSPSLIHDVAVLQLVPSSRSIYVGETLDVSVLVKNQGNYAESFNVTLFYDSYIFGVMLVDSLMPETDKVLSFQWNTSGVTEGNYSLSVKADLIPEEINVENNVYVDGLVEVKNRPLTHQIHDVAVLNVVSHSSLVYVGDIVAVDTTVKNKGDVTESFNVLLCCNGTARETLPVNNLPSGTEYTLTFHWNTSNAPKGSYTLSVYAEPIEGESNLVDNTLTDGTISIVASAQGFLPLNLFSLLLPLLLTILAILLVIWFCYRRRRDKQNETAFSSGWTAWFCCHNLQHGTTGARRHTRRHSRKRFRP
jgi:hypothetical protein